MPVVLTRSTCKQKGRSNGERFLRSKEKGQNLKETIPPARLPSGVSEWPERARSEFPTEIQMSQHNNVSSITIDEDRTITIKADTETLAILLASSTVAPLLASPGSWTTTASLGSGLRSTKLPFSRSSIMYSQHRDTGLSIHKDDSKRRPRKKGQTSKQSHPDTSLNESNYLERLGLFDSPLWPTLNEFECPLCLEVVGRLQGILIKACMIHKFCRNCLQQAAINSQWLEVDCPLAKECHSTISDAELKELLSYQPELYQLYLAKKTRHHVENDLTQLQPYVYDWKIITNVVEFVCPVCMETIPPLEGVCAKTCRVHYFCVECMRGAIRSSDEPRLRCPAVKCESYLLDIEVEHLAPEEHARLMALGVEQAIAAAGADACHCRVPDCQGVWFVEGEGEGRFECPVCKKINCLTCDTVHVNWQSCEDYRQQLENEKTREQNARDEVQTKDYIEKMIREGKGMVCPRCHALVDKMSGCDALQCLKCRTDLCWATKGLRWGPKGRGDNSGGCRCRYNGGNLCHPQCQNCH
ncbi:ranBP-type and C3HC4-type zinc finger-containing protein 1-like isoform X2 [Varroa jacobsoni]|uniref:ranBP-type and C3HC4-type zinc finger-containing protein 1-like isoform X2 n=1 Tax=Varroa jacobsoni TaxID=62625 RepID=UPI000BF5E41F|nr:ranBP-type and C3HC4-type zinc finger-containing protein 1-like isoform X2 [Varroa jacobsoni]